MAVGVVYHNLPNFEGISEPGRSLLFTALSAGYRYTQNWNQGDSLSVPGPHPGGYFEITYIEGSRTCVAKIQTREQGTEFIVEESAVKRTDDFNVSASVASV